MTAVAVLLSIRRESLFIAVLGLLGGFATPVAAVDRREPADSAVRLSAPAQRRPGVGGGARKRWPILSILTLVFTTHLPVGLGGALPQRQPALAGDGHLPRVRGDRIRRVRLQRAFGRASRSKGGRSRNPVSAAAVMPLIFAALPRGGPGLRRTTRTAVRVPADRRHGPTGGDDRARRGARARARRRRRRPGLRRLAGDVVRTGRVDHRYCVRFRVRGVLRASRRSSPRASRSR